MPNHFPFTGRLVTASVGWCRCVIKVPSATKPRLIVQTFDSESTTWINTNLEIDAYYGLPTNDDMSVVLTIGMVVWCIYIHKNHFIVLAECQ